MEQYRIVELLFYHNEKLQSTKTMADTLIPKSKFYHNEKLQSTKTTHKI